MGNIYSKPIRKSELEIGNYFAYESKTLVNVEFVHHARFLVESKDDFRENTSSHFLEALKILRSKSLITTSNVFNQIEDFHLCSIQVLRSEREPLSNRFWNMLRGGNINLLTRLSFEEFDSKFQFIQQCRPSSVRDSLDEWDADKTLYWHLTTIIHHKLTRIPACDVKNMIDSNHHYREDQFRITFMVIFDVPSRSNEEDKAIDHQMLDILYQFSQLGKKIDKLGILIPLFTKESFDYFYSKHSALCTEFSGKLVIRQKTLSTSFDSQYYIKIPLLFKILILSRLAEMSRILTDNIHDHLVKIGTYTYDDCLCASHLLQNYRSYSFLADLFEQNVSKTEPELNKNLFLIYKKQVDQSLQLLFDVFESIVSSGIDRPSINLICTFCTINWSNFLPVEWRTKFSLLSECHAYNRQLSKYYWIREVSVHSWADRFRLFMAELEDHMRKIKDGIFAEKEEYDSTSTNLPPLIFVSIPSHLVIMQNQAFESYQQTAKRQLFEEWMQAFVDGLEIILGAAAINASLLYRSRHMKNTKYVERYFWNERVWIEGPYRPRFHGTSTTVGKPYLYNSFIPRKYLAHLIFNLYTRAIKSGLLTSVECISLNKTLTNFLDVFYGRLDFKRCLVFPSTNKFDIYNSALLCEILEFIVNEDQDDRETEKEVKMAHYNRIFKKQRKIQNTYMQRENNGNLSILPSQPDLSLFFDCTRPDEIHRLWPKFLAHKVCRTQSKSIHFCQTVENLPLQLSDGQHQKHSIASDIPLAASDSEASSHLSDSQATEEQAVEVTPAPVLEQTHQHSREFNPDIIVRYAEIYHHHPAPNSRPNCEPESKCEQTELSSSPPDASLQGNIKSEYRASKRMPRLIEASITASATATTSNVVQVLSTKKISTRANPSTTASGTQPVHREMHYPPSTWSTIISLDTIPDDFK